MIEGLADDVEFRPVWGEGECPQDDDAPAVQVQGFQLGEDDGRPTVDVLVGLRYLDEFEAEDENEEDDDDGEEDEDAE